MSALVLALALAGDAVFGELPTRIHPVVWMGNLTNAWLRRFPPRHTPRDYVPALGLLAALLALFVVPAALSPHWLLDALILSTTFSFGYFLRTVEKLGRTFASGNLEAMRLGIGELVSRNTARLSQEECLGAAMETTVENITDAIVAPLLCYLVGGVPLAVAYRVVNTLDAMIGYKDRYFYYGKIAARIDDVLNFIPSRIVVALLFVVASLRGKPIAQAWEVYRRDRNKTESPNAGQTISALAGLLGVRLSKREAYDLGDGTEPLSVEKFHESVLYLKLTTFCFYGLALLMAFLL